MKKIHILLIEDNRLLSEGILLLINKQDDMRATAAVGSNEAILKKIRILKPLILLLDLGLTKQNSLQILKTVKRISPVTKVIVMDLVPTQEDVLLFVQEGVSGFILKDATVKDFLQTIRSVAGGNTILPSLLAGSLFTQIIKQVVEGEKEPSSKLMKSVYMTRREKEVIKLISDGLSNKEIAQNLHLSPYTVKSHVHNILEKLTLRSRVQIARYAHNKNDYMEIANTISLMNDEILL